MAWPVSSSLAQRKRYPFLKVEVVLHLHPQPSKHSTGWISVLRIPSSRHVYAVDNPLNCPWWPTVPASAYVDEDQGLHGVE